MHVKLILELDPDDPNFKKLYKAYQDCLKENRDLLNEVSK
jgi:hypothetical protein